MKKFLSFLARQPRWLLWVVYTLLATAIGVINYLTRDASIGLFHIVPIFLAVWTLGGPAGIFIAVLSGIDLVIVNSLLAPGAISIFSVRSWNALMESMFLILTGNILTLLKKELDQKKKYAEELEAANQELDAFNYSVAHDLRRPLNNISGYCQYILSYAKALDQESRENVTKIYGSTVNMGQLINALLNFSSLSKSEIKPETVNLSEIARSIAVDLRRGDPDRKIQLQVAEGVECTGDPRLLRVVLENLLGNAWKYTARKDAAVISFDMKLSGGSPVYYVRDNGAGFDATQADKVFIPFQRLHSGSDFAGFGIGLATVQRIIKRHGGRIWAEAEPEKGATFYFTLPPPK